MTHQIIKQRLVWEVPGVTAATAPAYHARMEMLFYGRLLPRLEAWLDRHYPGPEVYTMDRLELSLAIEDPETPERGAATALERALRQLGERLETSPPPNNEVAVQALDVVAELHRLLKTGHLPPAFSTARQVLERLPPDWPRQLAELTRSVPEATYTARLQTVLHQTLGPEDTQRLSEKYKAAIQGDQELDEQTIEAIESKPTGETRTAAQTPSESSTLTESLPTAFHPANAGIVLLHPYVDYLREQCDTQDDPALTARLLHYAAFGEAEDAEWDHPLTKVLLGMQPTDYLPEARKASDEQLAEVDELLDGVLEHWNALGSTERDGLRASFLQRDGKLERDGGGWLLHVDRRPYDMLLDRLPWSLALVKNSLMSEALTVHWR